MHLRPETRTTEVTTDKQNDAQEKANGRLMIPSTNSFLRRSSVLTSLGRTDSEGGGPVGWGRGGGGDQPQCAVALDEGRENLSNRKYIPGKYFVLGNNGSRFWAFGCAVAHACSVYSS